MAIPGRWKWAVDLDTREMAVRLIENGDDRRISCGRLEMATAT